MALEIGDDQASSGMSKAIFDALSEALSKPPPDVKTSWQKLAFAVATGVITHLKANLEISGVQVTGTATLPVSSNQAQGTVTLDQTGGVTVG